MNPARSARRPAPPPLSDHPAAWIATARDAAPIVSACPKCQGHVEVSYDPGYRHTRAVTGARHRTIARPDEVPALEMGVPVPDSPWKGFAKGPDTTVSLQAVDLDREEDRPPQRRIFRRCWNCGWGELCYPEPRTDASLGNHASPSPDLPWRARGRVFLHLEQRWVTREQFAVKAGLSPSYLHEVLAGIKRPSAQAVERLAAAAGVDPRKVLGSVPTSTGRDWLGFLEGQASGILDSDTDAARTGLVTGRTERVRLPTRPRRRQPARIYTAPGEPPIMRTTRAAQREWARRWDPAWTPVAAQTHPRDPLWQITDAYCMPKPWDSVQLDSVRRYLDKRNPH